MAMAWTDATDQAVARAKLILNGHVDKATVALTKAWSAAWDVLASEYREAVLAIIADAGGVWPTRTQVLRAQRARAAMSSAAASIAAVARDTEAIITADLAAVVAAATEADFAIIASQLPGVWDAGGWGRVSDRALDAIVTRTTKRIHSLTKPLPRWVEVRMKAELVRGVSTGSNPRTTARLIVNRCGDAFAGGRRRAEVISRTEIIDAYRAAGLASRKQNAQVVDGWIWICALDPRSCIACVDMHGSEHDANESGPSGHQCCRCTSAPRTKSWRELGFDIDEPPSTLQSGQEWFDALAPAEQRSIMGPSRLAAYQDGKIGWGEFATLRTNPGWRDSWVPAPVLSAA